MSVHHRSLISAFFSIASAKLVTMVITIIFTPLLVRLLGADQYGDYAFVLAVLGLLMIFVNSGVGEGLRKHLPEGDRPQSWQSDVFGFYTRFSFVLSFLVAVPILTLSFFDFFGLVDENFVQYFQLIALLIIFKQFYRVTNSTLMGLGYERYSEPLGVLRKGIFAVMALLLAYLGYGVTGVLVAYVLSVALIVVISTVVLINIIDLRSIARSHLHLPRRELLSFNFLSIILTFLMVSLYEVDILLLRPLVGDTETGYYKSALVVAQIIWMVPNTLQTLLLHSSSNYWTDGKLDTLNHVASLATRFTLISTTLMAAGLVVLASDFMPLYFGSEFDAAVTPMLLLLPGVIGFAVARPMFAIGQGSGKLRVLIYATGGAAVINIILNVLLIPQYGMNGAAVATSIGYGSMAVFYVSASRAIGFNPINDLRLIRIGVSTLVALVVMHMVNIFIHNQYIALVVIPIVGTVTFGICIFRTGAISEQETKSITKKLPNSVATHTDRIISLIA